MNELSVIVISFNGAEFVEGCLSSLISSQARAQYEIVVVDNGSSDSTTALIESKFGQVKLIKNESNFGFARAANQGIKVSNGEIILLLNQDTVVRDNAIDKLAERLKTDESLGVIGPKFVGFDGKLQKSCRCFPRYRDLFFEFTGLAYIFRSSRIFANWKMGWFDHLTEREVDQPMGAAMMFRRSLYDRLIGIDETFPMFFNDVDFCRRAKEIGFINLYYPEAVIEHFVGGSTRKMRRRMIMESHRSMYRYFKKYKKSGPLAIAGLYSCGILLFLTSIIRSGFSLIRNL